MKRFLHNSLFSLFAVCRALGIPARSVTNFASAHDTHNSLTVDYFYDEDGEPLDKLNIDSVWYVSGEKLFT